MNVDFLLFFNTSTKPTRINYHETVYFSIGLFFDVYLL